MRRTLRRAGALAACFGGENPLEAWAAGWYYALAARRLSRGDRATDALCMLVVCNTASIQLIPATVAAVRGAAGSRTPFDILPAVWLASALSVGAGILACRLLARLWRD